MAVLEAPSQPRTLDAVRSPWTERWRWIQRLLSVRLAKVSLGALVLVVFAAIFANVISPADPLYQDYRAPLESPSLSHPFGTDNLGRDILSRVIHGARISVSVGLLAVGLAAIIGVPLGLIAAYAGGFVDDLIMRVMDALMAFPALVLALGITAALGPSLTNVMIAIGLVYMPAFARLVRAEGLSVREREFVIAARTIGARPSRLIARHIWPNVAAPIIVLASLRVATAIITEAGLSFLGAGVPPPTPSWGSMLRTSYQYTETAPWMAIFPGLAIFFTVLATNLFGDALRTALDPRLRGSR
jgi:peptide/nickel transport system permease protein